MKAARMEPGNVFTLIFFLVVFFFYREVYRKAADSQKADRRMRVTAAVLALKCRAVEGGDMTSAS